jgi:hypothetical protein
MTEVDLLSLLKQFGPFVGLLGFFVWRDKAREERLGMRLDAMQDRYATTMEGIAKDSILAMNRIANSTDALSKSVEVSAQSESKLADLIMEKPCLLKGRQDAA